VDVDLPLHFPTNDQRQGTIHLKVGSLANIAGTTSLDTASLPDLAAAIPKPHPSRPNRPVNQGPQRALGATESPRQRPPPPLTGDTGHPRPPPPLAGGRDRPPPPPPVGRESEPARPPLRPPAPPAVERVPRSVEIVILSGEMKVRGKAQQLERVSIRMTEGESRELSVKAGGETRNLSLHYGNGELSIDGTPGRGRDAVRLAYEKEWRSGKVYRVALKGRVQLDKLEVKVTGTAN